MRSPKIPVVINEFSKNAYGSPRGYKVQLNRPLLNLEPEGYARSKALGEFFWLVWGGLEPDGPAGVDTVGCSAHIGVPSFSLTHTPRAARLRNCVPSSGFMKYSFAATKHKDSEAHSSSIYGQANLASPPNSLPDYIDGDNIRNQDVVVWVNSGLYHIPVSEDAPVTPTTGNMLSFSLIPFNWASENPATDMADMIQITSNEKAVPAVKEALARCAPTFTDVPFGNYGWEAA
jgi:hypothetical protein